MTSKFNHKIIEELYENEEYSGREEAYSTKVSFSGKVTDITLIDAIASRFDTTRTSILSSLIGTAALEMYWSLSEEDRRSISSAADLETTRILTKKGIIQTVVGLGLEQGESSNEDRTWRGYSDLIDEQGLKDADS